MGRLSSISGESPISKRTDIRKIGPELSSSQKSEPSKFVLHREIGRCQLSSFLTLVRLRPQNSTRAWFASDNALSGFLFLRTVEWNTTKGDLKIILNLLLDRTRPVPMRKRKSAVDLRLG